MAENLPEMMKTYKSTNIGSKVYHSKAIFIKRRMNEGIFPARKFLQHH